MWSMASVVFVVNPAGWNHAFKSWNGAPVGSYMRRKNLEVEGRAKLLAPGPHRPPWNTTGIVYGTGETAGSIASTEHHSTGGDLEGHVVAKTKQALWVHEGTNGPYVIKAKVPGKNMRFFWHRVGRYVAMPRVSHPGIRMKQPFLRRALEMSIH